ncbi:hypothetical protein [Nocardia sp. JMUB6875]|uniref:terpene synthase family protein n=1 Tax=Nocardia sp. JMUB6875 TaxID=3158170 RepID=UPI0034E88431
MSSPISETQWRLPPFYCPIEPAIHPKVDRIEQRAISWMDKFGLYRNDADRAWGIASNASEFVCRILPTGREDRLQYFAEFIQWAFAFDDTHHDTVAAAPPIAETLDLHCRIIRGLEAPGSQMCDDHLITALEDIAARIKASVTPQQYHRFVDGVRIWLLGCTWESNNTEQGIIPTLADYTAIRMWTIGSWIFAAFAEIVDDFQLPGEVRSAPAVRAVAEATFLLVGWDNDVLSYAKELRESTTDANILSVLMHHNRCSLEQALISETAMRDRVMTLFLALHEQLSRGASPELQRYLDDLAHFIRGSIQCHDATPRYADAGDRDRLPDHNITQGLRWTTTPTDTSVEPLPIPTIAWWWKQLDETTTV